MLSAASLYCQVLSGHGAWPHCRWLEHVQLTAGYQVKALYVATLESEAEPRLQAVSGCQVGAAPERS